MGDVANYIAMAIPVFFLLIALEWWWARRLLFGLTFACIGLELAKPGGMVIAIAVSTLTVGSLWLLWRSRSQFVHPAGPPMLDPRRTS